MVDFGSKRRKLVSKVKNELEKDNKDVVIPQMPVGVGNQNFENWSKVLNELKINENTIIIAHSIAPIFVCKYLITNKIKVKKLIFVCGFINYLGKTKILMQLMNHDLLKILKNIKEYCNVLFATIQIMIHM